MSTQRYSVTPHPIETLLTCNRSLSGVLAVEGGKKKYGGILDADERNANLRMSCIPDSMLGGDVPEYDDFLEERRKLMALMGSQSMKKRGV